VQRLLGVQVQQQVVAPRFCATRTSASTSSPCRRIDSSTAARASADGVDTSRVKRPGICASSGQNRSNTSG
jgi:hypothetical protein